MAKSESHTTSKDVIYNSLSLLMGLMKQYKGHYYDKKCKSISSNEVCFYLEREWRYLPIVTNGEAYFLPEDDYMNEKLREEKRQELINHKYVLDFVWSNILEIGVSFKNSFNIINVLKSRFGISKLEAVSKIRII